MKAPSLIVKHSIIVGIGRSGHKTSVSLENAFWVALKSIADGKGTTLNHLVSKIDEDREHHNLSSAIRLFVLDHYKALSGVGIVPSMEGERGRMAVV